VLDAPAALELALDQEGRPAVNAMGLAGSPRALQARVTVKEWSQGGSGQVGARPAAALYNDGSRGLDVAPDVPAPSSQVGDVVAQISMTATDVSFAVTRCNVAVCSAAAGTGLTFLKERTSMATVALGEPHVLRLAWDAATHTVTFQLDGHAPVAFDPVAAGHPVAGSPGKPFCQLATHAGAAGPGVDFGAGSRGHVVATFQQVKSL
jgi:hypothetical protein